jgi:hypothetical protein
MAGIGVLILSLLVSNQVAQPTNQQLAQQAAATKAAKRRKPVLSYPSLASDSTFVSLTGDARQV